MFSLLMRAYDVELDRIIGPSWIMENMGPNLYQVDATMPPDTTKARYQLMMQQLLQERFHLEIHREKRNFPGYELVIAEGGPRLKESKPDPDATYATNIWTVAANNKNKGATKANSTRDEPDDARQGLGDLCPVGWSSRVMPHLRR